MTTYTCRGCERTVDPDLEPSPGEPTYCPDCLADLMRGWGDVA